MATSDRPTEHLSLDALAETFGRAWAAAARDLVGGEPTVRPLQTADSNNLDRVELTEETITAARIRQHLKARGMSQADLAARLQVSPAVVSRILSKPNPARLETLERIARAINVRLSELVEKRHLSQGASAPADTRRDRPE